MLMPEEGQSGTWYDDPRRDRSGGQNGATAYSWVNAEPEAKPWPGGEPFGGSSEQSRLPVPDA